MPKQDRVAPRTAEDIERRTNYRQTFGEFAGLVDEAKKAAADAELAAKSANSAVNNLDEKLDQDEIFNRLTNNGEEQGVYRKDGKIYLNASYMQIGSLVADLITSGMLRSRDGSTTFSMDNGSLSTKFDFAEKQIEMSIGQGNYTLRVFGDSGYDFADIFSIATTKIGEKYKALITDGNSYTPDNPNAYPGLIINGRGGLNLGSSYGDVVIKGKAVSWKDNGDGTYTLIGTD